MATDVPMSLDERSIERFHVVDRLTRTKVEDPDLDDLAASIKLARETALGIAKLAEITMKDRTQLPEAGLLQVRSHALKASVTVATKLDAARAKIVSGLEQFERDTAAPPLLPATAAAEAEVRAAFLNNMTEAQRKAAISGAFKTQNKTVLGAVLRWPHYLSGLSPAYLEIVRHRYRKEFFPSEYERHFRLKKALSVAEGQGTSFVRFVNSMANSPAVALAEAAKKAREELQAIYSAAAAA